MAQNFLQRRLKNLFLVLVLTTAIYLAKAADLKETTLSLYFQDISAPDATNATVIPVAGIAGKARTFTQFGTVFVIDDYITEGPDPKSPEVGRAQGMYVTAGLDGLNSHVMISIVFTNKEYSKSTLEIQGVSKQIEAIREVSVVSGTGKFRFARGYATFETYSFHVPTCHAVIRCNVTLVDSIKGMDPRLVEAALNGNTIELQRLLGEDSLLLERDSLAVYPETALHIATMGGQTEFVRELLKLKPDFATRLDKNGFSAIHIASANGFVETVRELLKFARLKSSDGRTSLHCAAVTGRVQVIRELLGSFPDCMEDLTPRDETALHLTVKYNQFEAFKAMFDMLKQLNMQEIMSAGDEDGYTVLHLAVARKQIQVDVVAVLIASATIKPILSPPNGIYSRDDST